MAELVQVGVGEGSALVMGMPLRSGSKPFFWLQGITLAWILMDVVGKYRTILRRCARLTVCFGLSPPLIQARRSTFSIEECHNLEGTDPMK
jgi:hypothetical protein